MQVSSKHKIKSDIQLDSQLSTRFFMAAFTFTQVRLNSNPRSRPHKPPTLDARWQTEFCLTKFPVKVYSKKLLEASEKNLDDGRQNVDAVRDLKQVQNTIHSAHVKARSTDKRIII